jgi:hypothetical protein
MPNPCTLYIDSDKVFIWKKFRQTNGIGSGATAHFENNWIFILKERVPSSGYVFGIFEDVRHFLHLGEVFQFST